MDHQQAFSFDAVLNLFTAREIRPEYNDLVDAIRKNILAPSDQSLQYFTASSEAFVEAFVKNYSNFDEVQVCDMINIFLSGYIEHSPELLKVIQDQNSPFR